MSGYREIRDPGEAAAAPPGETFLVRSEDLARWVREAAEAERQACVMIVEHHLRLLVEERHLDAVLLMERVVHRIEARAGGAGVSDEVAPSS